MNPRITVPGNLLLMGEYAVLEEGGLGITLSPDIHVTVEIHPSAVLEIEGIMGSEKVTWSEQDHQPGLFDSIAETVRKNLYGPEVNFPFRGKIVPDSSQFYYPGGRKAGLGSSAAVASGVTAAMLIMAGLKREEIIQQGLKLALQSHRLFQDGRGSGYDILTSFYGGVGLFSGGKRPGFTQLSLGWFPPACLYRGEQRVVSSGAIGRYQEWKRSYPEKAALFLSTSNKYVEQFARAESWEAAAIWFRKGRKLGLDLGNQLGVPASLPPPAVADRGECKALGAGNELGIILGCGEIAEGLTPLVPAPGGLCWK